MSKDTKKVYKNPDFHYLFIHSKLDEFTRYGFEIVMTGSRGVMIDKQMTLKYPETFQSLAPDLNRAIAFIDGYVQGVGGNKTSEDKPPTIH